MKNFITSDTHYNHANIIRYSKRPFLKEGDLTVDGEWVSPFIKKQRAIEMTDNLIERHNAKVAPEDTVWHLGDFCFGNTQTVINILRRLNGNFKFIWGNHDEVLMDFSVIKHLYSDLDVRVEFLGDTAKPKIEGQNFYLNHYAHRVWDGSHKGVWHLYGHSHGTLPDDPNSKSFDIGVDCHDFSPLTIAEIGVVMNRKSQLAVDHHIRRTINS